jgi:hypothetical protein
MLIFEIQPLLSKAFLIVPFFPSEDLVDERGNVNWHGTVKPRRGPKGGLLPHFPK